MTLRMLTLAAGLALAGCAGGTGGTTTNAVPAALAVSYATYDAAAAAEIVWLSTVPPPPKAAVQQVEAVRVPAFNALHSLGVAYQSGGSAAALQSAADQAIAALVSVLAHNGVVVTGT